MEKSVSEVLVELELATCLVGDLADGLGELDGYVWHEGADRMEDNYAELAFVLYGHAARALREADQALSGGVVALLRTAHPKDGEVPDEERRRAAEAYRALQPMEDVATILSIVAVALDEIADMVMSGMADDNRDLMRLCTRAVAGAVGVEAEKLAGMLREFDGASDAE